MKAITYTKYGPPDVLHLTNLAKPAPKENEVLIRVHAAAVTATDPIMRKGRPLIARSAMGFTKPKHRVTGDVFAGTVEETGAGVKAFRPGDEVYGTDGSGWGAHAEYKCLAETGALSLKPANLSFEEAVAVCDGAITALPFLRDAGKITAGQDVLINGASGSVGSFGVQLARHFGATVTGVCSTSSVDLVRSLGADAVIDYAKEDFTTARARYDIIFDSVGKSTFARCKGALKQDGTYLSTVLNLRIVRNMIATSFGSGKRAVIMFAGARPAAEKAKDLRYLKEIAETGTLKAHIDRRYPLDRIREAHAYVETGHKKGAVIVTFGEAG